MEDFIIIFSCFIFLGGLTLTTFLSDELDDKREEIELYKQYIQSSENLINSIEKQDSTFIDDVISEQDEWFEYNYALKRLKENK